MSQHTQREILDHAPKHGTYLSPLPSVGPPVTLSASDRADLVERISRTLAETYSLYLRTVGPIYCNLDKLTRREYEALIPAIDETAECIRSIAQSLPARFATGSEPAEAEEDRTPTGRHDHGGRDAEESPSTVASFTRRLRAVLGIPVDSEGGPTVHLRS